MSNMDDKLQKALSRLAEGEPLTDVADEADPLRPLLDVVVAVAELRSDIAVPSPQASLQRMLAYGQDLAARETGSAKWGGSFDRLIAWFRPLTMRMAFAVSLMLVFLIGMLMGGGLALAAQGSLPGQWLYPLKRTGETIHLNLTSDSAQRRHLLEFYNERRQLEVHLLLKQGQQAPIAFEGYVDSVSPAAIEVEGLLVRLTPETNIEGELVGGALIHLEAVTEPPAGLRAIRISVMMPVTPTSTPSPTLTLTPLPTVTPTLTPTPTATVTPMPTATPVLSRAADTLPSSPAVTPTATLQAESQNETPTPQPPAPSPTGQVETPEPESTPTEEAAQDNDGPDTGGAESGDDHGDDSTDGSEDNSGHDSSDDGGEDGGDGSDGEDN